MCTSLSGDVLIFMPGQEEIEVTCEVLAGTVCMILCMYTCIHTCICTIYVVIFEVYFIIGNLETILVVSFLRFTCILPVE